MTIKKTKIQICKNWCSEPSHFEHASYYSLTLSAVVDQQLGIKQHPGIILPYCTTGDFVQRTAGPGIDQD